MTWRKLWWLALMLGCQPSVKPRVLDRAPRYTLTDYLHALEARKAER